MKIGKAVRSNLWHNLDKEIRTPVWRKVADSVDNFVWDESVRNTWDALSSSENVYWDIKVKVKL
jgi:hypothetical protein